MESSSIQRVLREVSLDIYPLENLMGPTEDDRETELLVDVGGNVGHDINKLMSNGSSLAPRLVLQDRDDVVRLAKCPPDVTGMVHDLFTPQPVKGRSIDKNARGTRVRKSRNPANLSGAH